MAKEFGLQQVLRNRAAINRHERSGGASTAAMDRARHQLLARPRLAHDQHVDVGVRHLLDQLVHAAHGRAGARDVVKAVGAFHLTAEQFALGIKAAQLERSRKRRGQDAARQRLRQVVGRAQPQSGRGRVDCRRATHHHQRQRTIAAADFFHQPQAGPIRRPDGNHQSVEPFFGQPPFGRGRIGLVTPVTGRQPIERLRIKLPLVGIRIDNQQAGIFHPGLLRVPPGPPIPWQQAVL